MSSVVDDKYMVPAIAGTIDQLAPSAPPCQQQPPPPLHPRPRRNDQINTVMDYHEDPNRDLFDPNDYCQYIDESGESPHICSFRDSSGRTPFRRNLGRGRGYNPRFQRSNQFKGKCKVCNMTNHHASSCHFLLKCKQALTYLGFDPNTAFKKKAHFRGKNSFKENRAYVRSLMDAGFLPYGRADPDNFVDVVDGNHDVFTPDVINSVEDDNVSEEE